MRVYKVTNSLGIFDVYRFLSRNKWFGGLKYSSSEFSHIIKDINSRIAESISLGYNVKLPYRMGLLELRKYNATPRFVNGKLKVKYPIDWKSTLKLWDEDTYAKNNKTLVRYQSKYVYFVYYNKYSANYRHLRWYEFKLNRTIKKSLSYNINNNKIDAYLM